jgi:putative addiction module CopG family antidote
LTISANRTILE